MWLKHRGMSVKERADERIIRGSGLHSHSHSTGASHARSSCRSSSAWEAQIIWWWWWWGGGRGRKNIKTRTFIYTCM